MTSRSRRSSPAGKTRRMRLLRTTPERNRCRDRRQRRRLAVRRRQEPALLVEASRRRPRLNSSHAYAACTAVLTERVSSSSCDKTKVATDCKGRLYVCAKTSYGQYKVAGTETVLSSHCTVASCMQSSNERRKSTPAVNCLESTGHSLSVDVDAHGQTTSNTHDRICFGFYVLQPVNTNGTPQQQDQQLQLAVSCELEIGRAHV